VPDLLLEALHLQLERELIVLVTRPGRLGRERGVSEWLRDGEAAQQGDRVLVVV
jgi:hypothetical protein